MEKITEKDLEQLSVKGISRDQLAKQIEIFKEGIPFVRLEKPALVSDGIKKCSPEEEHQYISGFEDSMDEMALLKFVPASGAASRMFKALFNFLDSYNPDNESLDEYLDRTEDAAIRTFIDGLEKLPFYEIVRNRLKGKPESRDRQIWHFVKELLDEDGLNYGFYPKGLLPFHNYGSYVASPFEEHLKEAARYDCSKGVAKLHFTISEQHSTLFNQEYEAIRERVSQQTKTSFEVGYSYQKASTDTIAVTPEDEPFRNPDGSLLFRPGGHGALIENLDEQEADVIFIKNIDNVVVPSFADEVAHSKKVLGGLLLDIQKKAHNYARMLDGDGLTGGQLQHIKEFLFNELNVRFPDNFSGFSVGQQIEILRDKINRPIRICGMVKNEGEPGGGPFWIKDASGNISLQIIESAQVDMSDQRQLEIFKASTHFNPVDIVCAVRNYKGEKFQLRNFVDTRQGFITGKTKEGKHLKALELPGLWNGGMAFWNTLFVEVPLRTFNPVKTVNDLLKPAHQPESQIRG